MKRFVLAVAFFCLFSAVAVLAAEATPSESNSLLDSLKHPTDWIEVSGDLRYRKVYGENWMLNEGARDYDRIRARLGAKFSFAEEVEFNIRLTQEFFCYGNNGESSVDFDEIVFDNLNLKIGNFLDMPVTAVFGRQDMILSKWLILDGTPLDGSRTIFFDAARFTVDIDTGKTLDLIYTQNYDRSSDTLKSFSEQSDRRLTQNDEQGVIVYYKDKSNASSSWEAYFIFKEDDVANIAPRYNPAWSKEAEIYTFGGAYNGTINDNMSYRLEAAIQTGEKAVDNVGDPQDLLAFGTLNSLCYSFNDEKKNLITLEYEYLSGDDPSTDDNEGFDPLWGEWPRYSEMYVYTQAREGSLADHTNLHRIGLTHSFNPTKKTAWTNAVHLLWAAQDGQGAAFSGNSDTFRGQLFTSCLKYSISKNLTTRFNAEYFVPGNYYADDFRNESIFLRAEVVFSF